MFGFRPDGRAVGGGVDPMTRITPFIMTSRIDAQVFCDQYIDDEPIAAYIRKKHEEGVRVSRMAVIIAAWLRAASQLPSLNRFVIGKKLFARNELTVTFMTLKIKSRDEFLETATKIWLQPDMTIFEVSEKVEAKIAENRKMETATGTDKVANALLAASFITGPIISFLKWLDNFGLMPRAIVDASPFHTSLFITNMGSVKMNKVYHHIYKFGTTSVFIGMGAKEPRIRTNADGEVSAKTVIPLGVVVDERIQAGAQFAMCFGEMQKYLRHPELLEVRPEKIVYDNAPVTSYRKND